MLPKITQERSIEMAVRRETTRDPPPFYGGATLRYANQLNRRLREFMISTNIQ